ncbi:hydrogenase expression protein HypF [Streptomyces sp. 549]|uniref:hydrogenase expression protein HypF n=1 Tax=Streptomyces sp. 549 TaxID=3049076 RepID=UPI0024C40446|nr:hydrogenase expression protein HypF [Streptomyces sp. 549]MDK1474899.1 hydrogenase expression protein HypF [Streptomyces sp. 549]
MPDDRPARTGPRHAAPRKPLLTRLHVPTGKAVALAAMPSAVLMSMGLMPQLASARPLPDNPFADGPCVTAPDREQAPADGVDGVEGADGADGREDAGGKQDAGGVDGPEADAPDSPGASGPSGVPRPGASGGPQTTPSPGPKPTAPAAPDVPKPAAPGASAPAEPAPAPSPSATRNPLDPLGIGDALRDLLTPGGKPSPTPTPSGTPEAAGTEAPDTGAAPGRPDPSAAPATGGAAPDKPGRGPSEGDATGSAGRDAPDAAAEDLTADAAEDLPADAAEDLPADAAAEEESTPEEDAAGKEPFPCPEFDAEAYRDAAAEPTAALVPDTPWRLESTRLTLLGLKYHGIVQVTTFNGAQKRVLKFTADSLDIRDLHQLVDGPAGSTQHVRARAGSTSTIRGGTVTMYTEELKGKLFGLIPITFSPKSPPPLDVPVAFFTDVRVVQAGQFGGTLTVPGMRLTNSG